MNKRILMVILLAATLIIASCAAKTVTQLRNLQQFLHQQG